MKVYISTYHNEKNFGAALQAHAMQRVLEKLGHSSELIDYEEKIKTGRVSFARKVVNTVDGIYNMINKSAIRQGNENFKFFFNNYHKKTRTYSGYDDLCNDPPQGDVYLSGSDQVFNTKTLFPRFFLQFGDENVKRISYAASVGVSSVQQHKEEVFRSYLASFDYISIREAYSKDLVSKYTEKDINVNVDPSFLLDRAYWESISSDESAKLIKEPYILVYVIYKPKWLNEVLKELKKATKCKIVLVTYDSYRPIFRDKTILNAGPREFLGLIKNAEMVVSSSFHGNVFASIFEKSFYAVVNPNSPARIKSMLETFGLEDRILTPETKFDFNVDYSFMREKLVEEKNRAKDYLINAMGEKRG